MQVSIRYNRYEEYLLIFKYSHIHVDTETNFIMNDYISTWFQCTITWNKNCVPKLNNKQRTNQNTMLIIVLVIRHYKCSAIVLWGLIGSDSEQTSLNFFCGHFKKSKIKQNCHLPVHRRIDTSCRLFIAMSYLNYVHTVLHADVVHGRHSYRKD